MPSAQDITFVIPGQLQATRSGAPAAPRGGLGGQVKASVRVAARRAGGESVRVTATPDQDVVVLHMANGPALVLHPETARDLLLGQSRAKRSSGATNEVDVAASLGWTGLEQAAPLRTRGFLGDVLVSAVEILTGFAPDLIADRVVARVDGQVEAGVYTLSPESLPALKGSGRRIDTVPAAPAGAPILVLLHGTFVDTKSTFCKLWEQHPGKVRELFRHYQDRVYALDHPTIGASPIANALTLAQALPKGARLHLATHSRGGLVAEVLARVCARPELSDADLKRFAGPAYAAQRRDLQALAALVRDKDIQVQRVVRVACPARGTLLASRRLDAYLSVLKWSLELAGVPVAPAMVELLTAVAKKREDPAKLPGLAAMMPRSPLVEWLNTTPEAIGGDLRVVAGDLEGDSIGSWIKTLLADAFYWTDNDIVVQTRSMYGGAPRRAGASFLLDQGGKVTHFNYFGNERTAAGVVSGLIDDRPSGFRPIGPLSWAGEDSSGVRAARAADDRPSGSLPAVFVLPGILGSHLKAGDKRIWLSLRLIGGLGQLEYRDGVADDVSPDGPIGMFYDDLIDHLSATHEVIPFAFDWRRPIEDEARRLADAVTRALDARDASGQPVRLIAHSMGGVVARTMQIEQPAVWQRLMARDGARLVMLGTPNGGSWAPMQVLSGDDAFGNALAAFGAPFQDREARQLMAAMPGFVQLQMGLLDDAQGLAKEATWRELAAKDLQTVREAAWWHRNWLAGQGDNSHLEPYEWGVPPQAVLDRAVKLRRALDAQREQALPAFADKLALVVGHAKFTPDGWEWTDKGLMYLDAVDGGDGRVPLTSALLPGVRTWSLDCDHGALPDAKAAFDAFVDLLARGDTTRLPRLGGSQRGAAAASAAATHVRSRPSRGQMSGARPAESMKALMATPSRPEEVAPSKAAGAALHVCVLNGDLTFVRQPLLVGHYRSAVLTGTEAVVDRMVRGTMRASLDAGLYPDGPGTHQIFLNTGIDADNPWRAPRPEAAIVIGLGNEGDLTAAQLTMSVRQATIAWSQRLAERAEGSALAIELAATLLGSGGLGISPGDAASAIARGVRDAAEVIRQGNAARREAAKGGATALEWPVVTRLTLVELYLERAAEAWRNLQVQATATPGHYDIAPAIAFGTGPLRRQIDTAYRGTGYDLITAETPSGDDGTIAFRLDTRRARTEVRAQMTQAKLVRDLITKASNDTNDDPQMGRTLFQLLVPQEVEPYLGGTDHMVLELDDGTAGIPWELLDPPAEERAGGDERPWAIRSKLLRKLRTADFRGRVIDASAEDHVLVVGEPALDDPRYAALPGALAEAREVAATFTGAGGVGADHVTALVGGANASTILNALLARRYRIVHIAGHGEPGELGGLVMSGGTFLGPREIATMRTVPELVFVNCCHLAARDHAQALDGRPPLNRPHFAATVADALIKVGVRCVIAAGWAVEDEPAKRFATTLYRELLAGQPFIRAVARAREDAWAHAEGGNTWAAYQCYGDPDWVFRTGTGDAQASRTDPREEYTSIASPLGLALALEELAVKSQYQGAKAAAQLEKIRHLEARFGTMWREMGAIAEAFGLAYAEAKAFDAAIDWYAQAVRCNDGSASMRATEQWLNLSARRALTRIEADAGAAERQAARSEIGQILAQLDALAALQPTIERHNLRGSAWKRLAMLERRGGDARAAAAALTRASEAYADAERLALASDHPDLFYPAGNHMATALVVHAGDRGWTGFDADVVARVRGSLHARITRDPDFWSMVGVIEIDVYEALAAGRLSRGLDDLLRRLRDLKARVAAPRMWASVADNTAFVVEPRLDHMTAGEREAAQRLLREVQALAKAG